MTVNIIYPNHEISRIITAAVINMRFRQDLLTNPLNAIEEGYGDETFELNQAQSDRLAKITASTLEEFSFKIIFA